MTDRFAEFGGAYVLGALSPDDRREFENHLRECGSCADRVSELAGVPGLLTQVSGPELPEPDVLPVLLARVRRARRWRWALAVGVAAAAVLAAVFGVQGLGVQRVEMTQLANAPVSGAVAVNNTESGTRIDMTCSYDGGRGSDYLLVAKLRDGSERTLARWHAIPDDTAEIRMGTELRDSQIRVLEIRLPNGLTVLRLTR